MIAPPRKGVEMYGQEVRERVVVAVLSGASAVARTLGINRNTVAHWRGGEAQER